MLGEFDHRADSGKFLEFLLTTVYDALYEISDTEQVEKLLEFMGDK